MISVLKVNQQVLAFRELIQSAAIDQDPEKFRRVLVPFQTIFLQDVAEASAALHAASLHGSATGNEAVQRTVYMLLSYQEAIPGEIDATLELAEFSDWQALDYRLNKQMLKNHSDSEPDRGRNGSGDEPGAKSDS